VLGSLLRTPWHSDGQLVPCSHLTLPLLGFPDSRLRAHNRRGPNAFQPSITSKRKQAARCPVPRSGDSSPILSCPGSCLASQPSAGPWRRRPCSSPASRRRRPRPGRTATTGRLGRSSSAAPSPPVPSGRPCRAGGSRSRPCKRRRRARPRRPRRSPRSTGSSSASGK
jgi:hypothetical protein